MRYRSDKDVKPYEVETPSSLRAQRICGRAFSHVTDGGLGNKLRARYWHVPIEKGLDFLGKSWNRDIPSNTTYWEGQQQVARNVGMITIRDLSEEWLEPQRPVKMPTLKEQCYDLGHYLSEDGILPSSPHTRVPSFYSLIFSPKADVFGRRPDSVGQATGCGYSHVPRNIHLVSYQARDKLMGPHPEKKVTSHV